MLDRDVLPVLLTALGISSLVGPLSATRASRALRWFGRRAGIHFVRDPQGRLAAGAGAERLVSDMIWRTVRAVGAPLAGVGLSYLALYHGAPLSRSTATSLTTAGLLCAGVVGAYAFVSPFYGSFAAKVGAPSRTVSAEDYLGPLRRVVTWLAALSAAVIPISAAALAASDVYDGSKVFWEGLVGIPLTCLGVLVASELRLARVRDNTEDDAALYLWDALRQQSVRIVTGSALCGIAIAWQMASAGLNGVALGRSPKPEWVDTAGAVSLTLQLVLLAAAVLVLATPARRFRGPLWPVLGWDDAVRWGPPAAA